MIVVSQLWIDFLLIAVTSITDTLLPCAHIVWKGYNHNLKGLSLHAVSTWWHTQIKITLDLNCISLVKIHLLTFGITKLRTEKHLRQWHLLFNWFNIAKSINLPNTRKKNHLHCCNQKCIIYYIFCMKIDFVLISNGMGLFTSWNYCCLPFKSLFAIVYPLDVLSFRKCVPLMRWINKYSQCIVNMRPQQKWYFLLFRKLGIFLENDLSNLLNNRHHAWMSNNVIY